MNKYRKMVNRPQKLLFICVENSNRSQMAEAFAMIHGQNRIEAFSAGSRPSGIVNPQAIKSMHELGYDLKTHRSKGLREIPSINYDVLVTMGCGDNCPSISAKLKLEWSIPDPKSASPKEILMIRNLIENKVKVLLASIQGFCR